MGLTPMEFLLEVTSTVRRRLGQGAPAPAIVNLISLPPELLPGQPKGLPPAYQVRLLSGILQGLTERAT